MATSPTVLAGSSSSAPASAVSAVPSSVAAPAPAKSSIGALLTAAVLGMVVATLGIGGTLSYLVRSGRLTRQKASVARVEPVVSTGIHVMVLEPMLVNLADVGNSGYLRVSLALRLMDAADKKSAKAKEDKSPEGKGGESVAAVRDTALSVLGRQTADGLLAADGKERLKVELKTAFAVHNADLKVTDVFFTDFLVQR